MNQQKRAPIGSIKSHRIPSTMVTMELVGENVMLGSLACPTAIAPGMDNTRLRKSSRVYTKDNNNNNIHYIYNDIH